LSRGGSCHAPVLACVALAVCGSATAARTAQASAEGSLAAAAEPGCRFDSGVRQRRLMPSAAMVVIAFRGRDPYPAARRSFVVAFDSGRALELSIDSQAAPIFDGLRTTIRWAGPHERVWCRIADWKSLSEWFSTTVVCM
jgi:hypothetical protein